MRAASCGHPLLHAYAAATQAAGRSQRWQLQCRVSAPGSLQRHQGHYVTIAVIQPRQDVKTNLSARQVRVLAQTPIYGDSASVNGTAAHAQANKLGFDSIFQK